MIRLSLLLLATACLAAGAPMSVARLPVIVPANKTVVEQFAGEELARYLQAITGKSCEIKAAAGQLPKSALVVGRKPAEKLGVKFSPQEFGDDGFVMRRVGDRIVLAGISDRGTLYAVYAFLEQLGCRWFAPNYDFYGPAGGEYVPRNSSPLVDRLITVEKASFQWRKKYVEEGHSHTAANLKQMIDWMAKTRMNVFNCPIDYQHEGKTRWDNWREELIPELRKRGMLIEIGGHGYPNFLPQDRYFSQHPEWFGAVNGKRTDKPNIVFSTANEEAVKTFIANVKAYLRAHPEIDIFDCWPPDGARWSDAPEDVALGSPTERQMILLNRLTRELKPDFPKLRVQFIAYASYIDPPQKHHPQPGMVMDFCPINRSFEAPIFDKSRPVNEKYFQALEGWIHGVIDPREVTIYSYITKYAWRSLPILIPHMVAEESKRYHEMKIGGWATYSEPASWATFELDHYFVARYAWNANLDENREFQDYVSKRYGAAAGPVAKYLRLVEEVVPHGVGIPGTELEPEKQKRLIERFSPAAPLIEEAKRLVAQNADLATLLDKLDGSRRYADNEMHLRMAILQNACPEVEKLLAARSRIIDDYGHNGVILIDWTKRMSIPKCKQ